MNLAFPAFLIFIFILPGLIFNLSFYNTENTPLKYVSLTHKTIVSSAITVILHTLGIIILYLCNDNVDFQLILVLISGVQSNQLATAISSVTTHDILLTSIYLLSMYFFAYFLGKTLRFLIAYFKLDEKFSFLRIDSPWYYLFKGSDWKDGEPDGVRIAAMVEIAGKGYLYIGWLYQFFLDSNGSIDRLVLTGAMRREIENDKKNDNRSLIERFYPIDGHHFVLKYPEIKSLNVQFLKLEELTK